MAKTFGKEKLPPNTITAVYRGHAGQSFGAWATNGMTLSLIGDSNDYVGKVQSASP